LRERCACWESPSPRKKPASDSAVAQFAAGQLLEAEHAFRYALELDPETGKSRAFCSWNASARACLASLDYLEAYVSLSHRLEDAAEHFPGFIWTLEARNFFHSKAQIMREWLKACRSIAV
jgi:tetratricopeptide (TPR) repeat protein